MSDFNGQEREWVAYKMRTELDLQALKTSIRLLALAVSVRAIRGDIERIR
jgi:hypothetical protein